LPLAAALALTGVAALAQTRPLQTEEATTAPSGTLVFETGGDLMGQEPNFLTGRQRTRYSGPLLRLVYSPSDNVETDLEWVAFVGAVRDPDFPNASDRGDVTLRAKIRFVDGRGKGPTLGARFWVSLPETKSIEGLGPNTLREAAEGLLSTPLGTATLHLNAGLLLFDEVLHPHSQRDFLSYGAALQQPLGARCEIVAESAGRLGKGSPGSDASSELRAGFRWKSGAVRYDAALRRGLGAADGKWGFTLGLAWTARRGGGTPQAPPPAP